MALAMATGMAVWLTGLMMPTADALPAGFFPVIGEQFDRLPVAMDTRDANGNFNAFIQLNPFRGKDSQLWKERFPVAGTSDVIRLENKAFPGQCLAWEPGSKDLFIKPCTLDTTKWRKRIPRFNKVILERTDEHNPDFGCAAVRDTSAELFKCEFEGSIWDVEPLGVVQTGLNPNPLQPPLTPTGCGLFGTATCGLVGFNCDPFSAADIIGVSSGGIGVGVTSVEPRLGLINGSYLNEGRGRVSVCATRAGMTSCGAPMDVMFGPVLCPSPGHHGRHCPPPQIPCLAGCGLPSNPECRLP
jgi:hypothetical protein